MRRGRNGRHQPALQIHQRRPRLGFDRRRNRRTTARIDAGRSQWPARPRVRGASGPGAPIPAFGQFAGLLRSLSGPGSWISIAAITRLRNPPVADFLLVSSSLNFSTAEGLGANLTLVVLPLRGQALREQTRSCSPPDRCLNLFVEANELAVECEARTMASGKCPPGGLHGQGHLAIFGCHFQSQRGESPSRSHRAINSATFAAIRFCSRSGGTAIGRRLSFGGLDALCG